MPETGNYFIDRARPGPIPVTEQQEVERPQITVILADRSDSTETSPNVAAQNSWLWTADRDYSIDAVGVWAASILGQGSGRFRLLSIRNNATGSDIWADDNSVDFTDTNPDFRYVELGETVDIPEGTEIRFRVQFRDSVFFHAPTSLANGATTALREGFATVTETVTVGFNRSFFISAIPTVSRETLSRNLTAQAGSRVISQFLQAEVFQCVIDAYVDESQELYNCILDVFNAYQLTEAEGDRLDVLGRRVGLPRLGLGAASIRPTDPNYSDLIVGKIFKNHVKSASIPEMIQFIRVFFDDTSIILRNSTIPFELDLIVTPEADVRIVQEILTVFDDNQVDRRYLIPMPATGRIRSVTWRPARPFIHDRDGFGYEQGFYALNAESSIYVDV